MNVEIGTEATQIPEKEHINGIFVAVSVRLMSTFELPVSRSAGRGGQIGCGMWGGSKHISI
jgi:hypothetical protein